MKTSHQTTLALLERIEKCLSNMLSRCNNPSSSLYRWYGGKGIKVCRQWTKNRYWFIKWALRHGFKTGLEIERINNKKGYYPSNCRFTSHSKNLENRGPEPFNGRRWKLPLCVFYEQRPGYPKRYKVRFARNKKQHYVGSYATVEEAVTARDKAIKAYERRTATEKV